MWRGRAQRGCARSFASGRTRRRRRGKSWHSQGRRSGGQGRPAAKAAKVAAARAREMLAKAVGAEEKAVATVWAKEKAEATGAVEGRMEATEEATTVAQEAQQSRSKRIERWWSNCRRSERWHSSIESGRLRSMSSNRAGGPRRSPALTSYRSARATLPRSHTLPSPPRGAGRRPRTYPRR